MLKQSLQQRLLQKLSPQQIQLMKLIQLPMIEMEQRVKEEIEDNPALEEGSEYNNEDDLYANEDTSSNNENDDFDISEYLTDLDTPNYKLSSNNYKSDEDEKSIPLAGGESFQEQLMKQISLRIKDDIRLQIAQQIIGNLDDSGYLRRELINISDDLAFKHNIMVEEDEIQAVLDIIQSVEPVGIGARSLQECLLIQIKRKLENSTSSSLVLAKVILEDFFEEFSRKHYSKIINKLEIEKDELKIAIDEIIKLNPKPANTIKVTSSAAQQVIPDFIINEENGELKVLLNSRNAPELKVSREYAEMFHAYDVSNKTNKDKEAISFIKQKLDAARWFIDAIKQRQHTLLITMQTILEYQYEYFLTADETKMKPMILKDIAEIIKMDISTVSRVANSKFVQTDFGIFPVRHFFTESITTTSGEEVSTKEVKSILQDIVDNEDKKKPITDQNLATMLKEKGYAIARRTVAKYREGLGIPVARLRKEL